MGDNPDPLTDEQPIPPPISHRRILIEMAMIISFGSLAGIVLVSARVGFGVLIGGVLAFANYVWQKHSLKAIFDRAIDGKGSRFLAIRYILRYVILACIVAIIYLSDTVSIYAVIFGLASFAIAVVIEGLIYIFSSSLNKES